MIKAHFPIVVILALAAGGCAQTPLRNTQTLSADAARYGVSPELLLRARSAGYSPVIRQGETFFCTEQAQTFSYVPKTQCFDKAHVSAQLQQSAAALDALQSRSLQMSATPPRQ